MNGNLSKNAFGNLHEFIEQNNLLWIYLVVISLNVVLFIVGWILSNWKGKVEIDKLKADINKSYVEVEELHGKVKKNDAETQKILSDKLKNDVEIEQLKNQIDKSKTEVEKLKAEIINLDSETKTQLLNFTERKNEIINKYSSNIHLFTKKYKGFQVALNGQSDEEFRNQINELRDIFNELSNSFLSYFHLVKELSISPEEKEDFTKTVIIEFLAWCDRLVQNSLNYEQFSTMQEYPFIILGLHEIMNYASAVIENNPELKRYQEFENYKDRLIKHMAAS